MQIGEPRAIVECITRCTRTIRLTVNALPDDSRHLYVGEPYRVLRGEAVLKEGRTEPDGQIEIEIKPGEESGISVQMLGTHFELHIDPLPPSHSQEGVKARLNGLGYLADSDTAGNGTLEFEIMRMEQRLGAPLTGHLPSAAKRLRGRFV